MAADLGHHPAPLPRSGQKGRFEAFLSRKVRGNGIKYKMKYKFILLIR
jgi:hypothetical protein